MFIKKIKSFFVLFFLSISFSQEVNFDKKSLNDIKSFPFDKYSSDYFQLIDDYLKIDTKQGFKNIPENEVNNLINESSKIIKQLLIKIEDLPSVYPPSDAIIIGEEEYDFDFIERVYKNIYYETASLQLSFVASIISHLDSVNPDSFLNKSNISQISSDLRSHLIDFDKYYLLLKSLPKDEPIGFLGQKDLYYRSIITVLDNFISLYENEVIFKEYPEKLKFYINELLDVFDEIVNDKKLYSLVFNDVYKLKNTGSLYAKKIPEINELSEDELTFISLIRITLKFFTQFDLNAKKLSSLTDGAITLETTASFERYRNFALNLLVYNEFERTKIDDKSNIDKYLIKFLPHYSFVHGDLQVTSDDIFIYYITQLINEFVNYARTYKYNGYYDKSYELIEFASDINKSFTIDDNLKYNAKTMEGYSHALVNLFTEELTMLGSVGAFSSSENSDIIEQIRERFILYDNFVKRYGNSSSNEYLSDVKNIFEWRYGAMHDFMKKNNLKVFKPTDENIDIYKEYYFKIKNTLNGNDIDSYRDYFAGFLSRRSKLYQDTIFSFDEINEIFNLQYDYIREYPTDSNIMKVIEMNLNVYGPTQITLDEIINARAMLSKDVTVFDIKNFPEKHSNIGYLDTLVSIIQSLNIKYNRIDEDFKKILDESIENGSFKDINEWDAYWSIMNDSSKKSILHSMKDDTLLNDYLKESINGDTYLGTFFQKKQKGSMPFENFVIISYNFLSSEEGVLDDYKINIMEFNISEENPVKLSTYNFANNIYTFKNSIDLKKSQLRLNLETDKSIEDNIYEVLIEPIEFIINKYKNVIIIQDPLLNDIPFETIKNKQDELFIKTKNISYSNSFEQFFENTYKKLQPIEDIKNYIVGDVDYSFADEFNNLTWTKNEIEYISKTNTFKNEILSKNMATETNFKKLILESKDPIRIHLSVHGIDDNFDNKNSSIVFLEDGLNDGYLKISEILDMDFSSVNLITLSACETNQGSTINNFGQLNIQHAFKMKGAKRVVSTLWKIDDKVTFLFMKEFYSEIDSFPGNISFALAEAKRNFIFKYPEYSSPYYWSGFVLYGF